MRREDAATEAQRGSRKQTAEEQIITLLEGGKLHHPAGKTRREYAPPPEAADGA